MSRATKYFWNNGSLHTPFVEFVLRYSFNGWFVNKSIAFEIQGSIFDICISKSTVEAIFATIQPSNISLIIISETPHIDEICQMCNCESLLISIIYSDSSVNEILYTNMSDLCKEEPEIELIDKFQRVSNNLTIIPYFKGIQRLSDKSFSKLDMLVFLIDENVSVDFLKRELFYTYW